MYLCCWICSAQFFPAILECMRGTHGIFQDPSEASCPRIGSDLIFIQLLRWTRAFIPIDARVACQWQGSGMLLAELDQQPQLVDVTVAHHQVHPLGVLSLKSYKIAQHSKITRLAILSIATKDKMSICLKLDAT